LNIEITTSPSEKDAKTISQGIVNFNHKMIPTLEPEETEVKFSVFARGNAVHYELAGQTFLRKKWVQNRSHNT
jgi:hypothetical protein